MRSSQSLNTHSQLSASGTSFVFCPMKPELLERCRRLDHDLLRFLAVRHGVGFTDVRRKDDLISRLGASLNDNQLEAAVNEALIDLEEKRDERQTRFSFEWSGVQHGQWMLGL